MNMAQRERFNMHPINSDQRHIPDAEGRVGSVDNDLFIHAIVPRHVECVVLMTRTDTGKD